MIEVHSAPDVTFDQLDASATPPTSNTVTTTTKVTTVTVETTTKQAPPAVSAKPVKKYQRENKGMCNLFIDEFRINRIISDDNIVLSFRNLIMLNNIPRIGKVSILVVVLRNIYIYICKSVFFTDQEK